MRWTIIFKWAPFENIYLINTRIHMMKIPSILNKFFQNGLEFNHPTLTKFTPRHVSIRNQTILKSFEWSLEEGFEVKGYRIDKLAQWTELRDPETLKSRQTFYKCFSWLYKQNLSSTFKENFQLTSGRSALNWLEQPNLFLYFKEK